MSRAQCDMVGRGEHVVPDPVRAGEAAVGGRVAAVGAAEDAVRAGERRNCPARSSPRCWRGSPCRERGGSRCGNLRLRARRREWGRIAAGRGNRGDPRREPGAQGAARCLLGAGGPVGAHRRGGAAAHRAPGAPDRPARGGGEAARRRDRRPRRRARGAGRAHRDARGQVGGARAGAGEARAPGRRTEVRAPAGRGRAAGIAVLGRRGGSGGHAAARSGPSGSSHRPPARPPPSGGRTGRGVRGEGSGTGRTRRTGDGPGRCSSGRAASRRAWP